MLRFIIKPFIGGLAVFLADYLVDGVSTDSLLVAFLTGLTISALNLLLKPILLLLTIPVTVVSLGCFVFIINAALIMLVPYFVHGFHVNSFFSAFYFSIIFGLFNSGLEALLIPKKKEEEQ
jgi:putative membrane protein